MLIHGRLTKSIYPSNYEIFIIPNIEKSIFDGVVEIQIIFDDEVNMFAIHSKDLTMRNITLDEKPLKYKYDKENELVIMKTDEKIIMGEHKLKIMYNGIIHSDLKGFYKSKYVLNGEIKHICTTQFESTDARSAFPCFDEPNFKATFDITVVHNKELNALSNCDMEAVGVYKDKIITKFKKTPIMSTYLVAFIIGDFEYIERESTNGIRVRVYGTKDGHHKMDFALDVACRTLDWFERWFGVKYPLPKLDLIGIPDFNSGAMENWGLITFRPELLYCDDETELSYKRDATITIIHELAHQWFGNLVTMEWWTYLWLNESMATYFGWWVTDELFPEWNTWDIFIDNEYNHALELDSLDSSHPIEVPVTNTKEINQIFDAISYSKGSCLVRFLASFIGKEKFREGMQKYIIKNMWKNTTSIDLWNAFDEVCDLEIKIVDLMSNWVSQKGYPVLIVELKDGKVKFEQQKYLKSGQTDDSLWILPINFYKDDGIEDHFIINSKNYEIRYNNTDFIVNPHRYGFYRVLYKNLTKDLSVLSVRIQKQLIGDSFAMSFSGLQNFTKSFELLNQVQLGFVDDFNMWNTILTNLTIIYNIVKRNEFISIYKSYLNKHIINHAKSLLKKIGFEDGLKEGINAKNLRPLLFDFLMLMDDPEIKEISFKLFSENKYKYVIKIIGKYATEKEFNQLMNLFETKTFENPQLKDEIIEAFGHTDNKEIINKIINEVMFQKIREQDIWYLISLLSANIKSTDLIWNFVKSNWKNILNIYKPGSSGLSYTIKSVCSGLCTNHELEDYMKFFERPPDGTEMVVSQSIEKIRNKISIIERIIEEKELFDLLNL